MVPSLSLVAALAATAYAGSHETCIVLPEAPLITQEILQYTQIATLIEEIGVFTLGLNVPEASGKDCVAKVTTVTAPTKCSITAIQTSTLTYPCSTPTTFTSCPSGSSKTLTYCWGPSSTSPSGSSGTCSSAPTVTVTASGSIGTTVTETALVTIDLGITITETDLVTISAPTVTYTATDNRTVTATSTVTATPSSSGCFTNSSTYACDKYGYLIQGRSLYQVDIASGNVAEIKASASSSGNVNALGYNVLDNYLYGHDLGNNAIIRIGADGTATKVATMSETLSSGVVGDIDTEGYYWYTNSGATKWYQHDLLAGSSTFAEVVANGTTASSSRTILDWVYVPSAGRYLWTVGTNSPSGGSDLMKWSMDTHTWTVVQNFPDITVSSFGALYGMNNGTLFASDNASGHIWAFYTSGDNAYIVSQGPVSSSNDGARCVLNTSL